MQTHDIIIIGGGIAGLTLATMLAQKTSLSILILEAKEKVSSNRVSAISLSSKNIFTSLNLWREIKPHASPFREIQVWDAAAQGEITFNANEIVESVLGYITENNVMQQALEKNLRALPNITMLAPIHLSHMTNHEDAIEFTDSNEKKFRAKLAIAADGANSWLRNAANINIENWDYHQHAIVATVKTSLPHHAIARQVFLPTGPLAFLPLMEAHTSSIVWSLPDEDAHQLMHLDQEKFLQKLSRVFEYRLGDVVEIGDRFAYPLHAQKAESYIRPRIALVGDAAHTVHPLAGQGLNMGLLDVKNLVEVIESALSQQRDFAGIATLRKYERSRKADNFILMSGIDFIKTLFASEKKSVQQLRSFGLNGINKMKWLKHVFTRHAVGQRI